MIVLNKRPSWNSITFIIARGGASLIDGLAIGRSERLLMAFRKNAQLFDNPLFWFSKPSAWDSVDYIKNPDAVTNTTEPKYTITPIRAGVWELRIDMDADWLDNAKYPVYIDPTIVLQPDATEGYDAILSTHSAHLANNWGGYKFMFLSYYPSYSPCCYFRPIILFNGIPSSGTIISAILSLYIASDYYEEGNAPGTIHRVLRQWGEGDKQGTEADDGECAGYWYMKPNYWTSYGADSIGNDIAASVDPNISLASGYNKWKDIDVSASLQNIIDSGNNYGWLLKRTNDNSYTYTQESFVSSDNTDYDPIYRPKLTIEYEEGGIFIPAKLGALAGKGIINPLATGII
ncbi:hypothetical protein DRQ26_05700 [bacterium]|nr:MAG: hypothetical protein DRQ26_05700 [bacterium]